MMRLEKLNKMHRLVRASYDQHQQSFGKILAQEAALRRELRRVDQMDRDARARVQEDVSMRTIGSDVIWQSWVGRTRTRLNLQLSRVLAVKEQHLAIVKKAYGKVLVVEKLIQNVKKDQAKARQDRELTAAIDFASWPMPLDARPQNGRATRVSPSD